MTTNEASPPRGLWSSRIALFSVLLICCSLFLHRLFDLPTPTFFVYLAAAWVLSVCALLLAIGSFYALWREGSEGAARIFLGGGIGLVIAVTPVILLGLAQEYPLLNDVTTNVTDPPLYGILVKERRGIANSIRSSTTEFATRQKTAYPDLQSLAVNRSLLDTFDLIFDTLQRSQIEIVFAEPPTDQRPVGIIEATHRTLLFGFYNDLAIRIKGDGTSAVIDLRSSSRYGKADYGYNAQLLRSLMRDISSKLGGIAGPSTQDNEGSPPSSSSKLEKKNSPKKGEVSR